jgi:hypothetical protein
MANPIKSFLRRLLPLFSPSNRLKKALIARGPDLGFEASIRQHMRFLFERFGASVVSNEYFPAAFGNVIVVIETEGLRLRFVQDRGEVRLDVAPLQNPTEWVDSAFALAAMEDGSGEPQFSLYRTITSIARRLDPKFEALQVAFTQDRYPATIRKMAEISERERARAVQRFNTAR